MFGKKTNTTATPATTTTTATVTPATTTKKTNVFKNLAPAFGAGFAGGVVAIATVRVAKKITHAITSKIGSGDPEPEPTPNNNDGTPDNSDEGAPDNNDNEDADEGDAE